MVEQHLGVEEGLLRMACHSLQLAKGALVGLGVAIPKASGPFVQKLFNGGEENPRENVKLKNKLIIFKLNNSLLVVLLCSHC